MERFHGCAPNLAPRADELRREFEDWRKGEAAQQLGDAAGNAAGPRHQISELTQMVRSLLDEAEERVNEHPVATVAGALALGIVIGRLAAR